MTHIATDRGRATNVARTTVVPTPRQPVPELAPAITEQEVAEKFAALVLPFTRQDLKKLSGRTTEAAKHWKAASRAPNTSSIITMGRRLRLIRDWLVAELDAPEGATINGAETFNAVMTGLTLAANLPGQEGVIARTLLSKLQQEGG